ncbi:unnamed protein product [Acanthoscelides obtectus]|uniref:Thiamine pyrophosphokinase 1 n=1 Tax=Acanthoscelides obtectus TaxID=200917 RepID=A0A9P0KKG4_ACAOB|nr:unnamed protein product [Acanthoscelides obtectus]CAK1666683.1 Thiamin pyrophosphokinase 1 [Acanthoscelides obtectus]
MEIWSPCEDITETCKSKNYGILILNVPIAFDCNHNFVMSLWDQAKVRMTVDGGTQRWMDWLKVNKYDLNKVQMPELISGDMDSTPAMTLEYFKNTTTQVIYTPDQNETDFVKALRELDKYCKVNNIQIDTIYALADTSGRLDQILANINTLYKCKQIISNTKLYLLAKSSLTWLLDAGKHSLSIPQTLRDSQQWCSLLPIGEPCQVSTTGLKWNLDKKTLKFGSLVSTSNTYDGSEVVTVETDHPVVWSMSIKTLL